MGQQDINNEARRCVESYIRFMSEGSEIPDYNPAFYSAFQTVLANQDLLYYYMDISEIISEGLDLALLTFDLNAKNPSEPEFKEPEFQLGTIKVCLDEYAGKIIEKIAQSYPTCYCTKEEIIQGSAYLNLLQEVSNYYANESSMASRLQYQVNAQTTQALRVAESKVTGLGFGILSSSIWAHLVYMVQNASEIKKQTAEAEQYLENAQKRINADAKRQLQKANNTYYDKVFYPRVRELISNVFWEMALLSLICIERECNVDISLVKQMDYEKSQVILSRIDFAPDKNEIITTALLSYPYNVHIYAEAKKRNLYEFFLDKLVEMLFLGDLLSKEIGLSMVDESNLEIEIGNIVRNNQIEMNDPDWKRLATEHVKKSTELQEKHLENFAPYGAKAAYLIAANMDSNEVSFWKDVDNSLHKFITLYKENSSRECLDAIIYAIRRYISRYARESCVFNLDEHEEFSMMTENQRWAKTKATKRRMIPAIKSYIKFIELVKNKSIAGFNVSVLENDLLWLVYSFGIAHRDVRLLSNGNYKTYKYHLPLKERNFIFPIYDNLMNTGKSNIAGGLYYMHKQQGYITDGLDECTIYRTEISTEGKRYFGMIVETPKPQPQYQAPQSNNGCYIATCVYGAYDCPQVWALRRYRDNVLKRVWYGRAFVCMYYAISPTLVKLFGEKKWFRIPCKKALDEVVRKIVSSGTSTSPYEDKK